MAVSLGGLAWGVEHGYLAIAVSMVVMTIGLRKSAADGCRQERQGRGREKNVFHESLLSSR